MVYWKSKVSFGIQDSEFQSERLSSKPSFRALYGKRRMSHFGWANQSKSDRSRNESTKPCECSSPSSPIFKSSVTVFVISSFLVYGVRTTDRSGHIYPTKLNVSTPPGKVGASSFDGRRLYTASCGNRSKWPSGTRTPLYKMALMDSDRP